MTKFCIDFYVSFLSTQQPLIFGQFSSHVTNILHNHYIFFPLYSSLLAEINIFYTGRFCLAYSHKCQYFKHTQAVRSFVSSLPIARQGLLADTDRTTSFLYSLLVFLPQSGIQHNPWAMGNPKQRQHKGWGSSVLADCFFLMFFSWTTIFFEERRKFLIIYLYPTELKKKTTLKIVFKTERRGCENINYPRRVFSFYLNRLSLSYIHTNFLRIDGQSVWIPLIVPIYSTVLKKVYE